MRCKGNAGFAVAQLGQSLFNFRCMAVCRNLIRSKGFIAAREMCGITQPLACPGCPRLRINDNVLLIDQPQLHERCKSQRNAGWIAARISDDIRPLDLRTIQLRQAIHSQLMKLTVMIIQLVPFPVVLLITQTEIRPQINEFHMSIIAFACQRLTETVRQGCKYDIRCCNYRVLITEYHITELIEARIQFTDRPSGIALGADCRQLSIWMHQQQSYKLCPGIAAGTDNTRFNRFHLPPSPFVSCSHARYAQQRFPEPVHR